MEISNEHSIGNSLSNLKSDGEADKSSNDRDDEGLVMRRKRVQRFSDSGSESEKKDDELPVQTGVTSDNENSNEIGGYKTLTQKSRIRLVSTSSDSESRDESDHIIPLKNNEQQARMNNKRNKIRQKFKSFITSRIKEPETINADGHHIENETIEHDVKQMSEDEASSIERIRQKIKDRTMHLKSTIYDPNTSEEDSSPPKEMQKQKKSRKSTKLTSPKPVRMSAKQAMENMQKIKSESNRMLREKNVSLPYHRPKALSLKDIMSRRRPAVSSDGKALPIKMNEDQLKQYVDLLEQRQKEIMELCKSDTEEEDTLEDQNKEKKAGETLNNSDTIYDDLIRTSAPETQIDECSGSITNQNKIFEETTLVNSNSIDKSEEKSFNKEVMSSTPDIIVLDNICNREDTAVSSNNNTNDNIIKENIMFVTKDLLTDDNIIGNTSKEDPKINTFDANTSAEMELVYNDSVEETNNDAADANGIGTQTVAENVVAMTKNSEQHYSKESTETDSQMISLHYNDSEKNDEYTEKTDQLGNNISNELAYTSAFKGVEENKDEARIKDESNNTSDDDMNMEDIDKLIENAEVLSQTQCSNLNSPMLIKDPQPLNTKPKLMGAPGMIIDLDGTDPFAIKKLTGVELLKERFAYFAKLKTPEEMEREREKRIKPGLQHSKLKHELEEKMAEQRSLEWAKRLQDEKQQQVEMDAIRGDASDAEDGIEKIESKLEENGDIQKESSSESADEDEEELSEVKEKPRKCNPMIADEAEESDCDEFEDKEPNCGDDNIVDDENEGDVDNCEESDEESSEEEEEELVEDQTRPRKGRILKAFEDSDDEDKAITINNQGLTVINENTNSNDHESANLEDRCTPLIGKGTQDEELQLAQMHKSFSIDLFTSQESDLLMQSGKEKTINKNIDLNTSSDDKDLGTQTFSLNLESAKHNNPSYLPNPDNLSFLRDTQTYDDGNLDNVIGMCSGSFSQNLVTSQYLDTENSQSQGIGEDLLALCTGKFYDNQFVSQLGDDNVCDEISQQTANIHEDTGGKLIEQVVNSSNNAGTDTIVNKNDALDGKNKQLSEYVIQNGEVANKIIREPSAAKLTSQLSPKYKDDKGLKNYEKNLLTSILDELNDPEFESPNPKKYFVGDDNQNKENKLSIANGLIKKKFTIDSDDEGDANGEPEIKKKKKFKKKKLEDRALHISDDDDEFEQDEEDSELSETENDTERIVEYDSEENEVVQEAQPEIRKKKRKVADFFEQEAELTSEDEWAGSGDEDEAGLDRMEREAGDDDTFHQGRLQRELGQIHMRDVLDQDKREVRLIQELLFEDGDLGGGHRQRKFRWRNEDGVDDTDAAHDEFANTQEEEFESEEQWRKQRHERETFLKQMQQPDETEDSLNTSVSRTAIIKANLCSRTMSSLLLEVNTSTTEKTEAPTAAPLKKTKDIPSPKKSFTIFQQNHHSSLLARGRGALARLAALATPLAPDDDAPKAASLAPASKRNFVFATLTQEAEKPKITKRKADSNVGTPKLVKKMKTEEKQNYPKSSLLDHIRT